MIKYADEVLTLKGKEEQVMVLIVEEDSGLYRSSDTMNICQKVVNQYRSSYIMDTEVLIQWIYVRRFIHDLKFNFTF